LNFLTLKETMKLALALQMVFRSSGRDWELGSAICTVEN